MTNIDIIKFPNELNLYICDGILTGEGEVIISVEQIKGFNEKTLFSCVQSAIPYISVLKIENEVDHLNCHYPGIFKDSESIKNIKQLLTEIEIILPKLQIDEYKNRLISQQNILLNWTDKIISRKARKQNLKRRRKEIDLSRDKLFVQVGNRDGFYCKSCNNLRDLTLDHILAVSNGGSDKPENLQLLCKSCNSKKGSK